jgi:hypothetical protein
MGHKRAYCTFLTRSIPDCVLPICFMHAHPGCQRNSAQKSTPQTAQPRRNLTSQEPDALHSMQLQHKTWHVMEVDLVYRRCERTSSRFPFLYASRISSITKPLFRPLLTNLSHSLQYELHPFEVTENFSSGSSRAHRLQCLCPGMLGSCFRLCPVLRSVSIVPSCTHSSRY